MEYRIISDMSDLMVLIKNSRVILITRDMSEITARLMKEDENYRNKVTETLKAADITTDLAVEEKSLQERVKAVKAMKSTNHKNPSDGLSLSKLLDI